MMTRTVISDDMVVIASENIAYAELDGESVLLDVNAGQYYGLNHLGSIIMNQIKEPTSVKVLKERILEDFDVDIKLMEADLYAFLEEMIKYNLVKTQEK